MSEKNFSYYQFRKSLGYQVYLKFEDFEFETQVMETIKMMGFDKVESKNIKQVSFLRGQTKLLKVMKATPRVARQISQPDMAFDKYGDESISNLGNYQVYRYKNVGMMIFDESSAMWELGLKGLHNQDALRIIFTRFLSYALEPLNIIGFWGVPVDEGFVVRSPIKAEFESVFVDINKNVILTYDGVREIQSEIQILRLDETLRDEMRIQTKESLISFLSMNTCSLNYTGLSFKMKSLLFDICQVAQGYIYPENNFKPRADISEAA